MTTVSAPMKRASRREIFGQNLGLSAAIIFREREVGL
jgi:hypothetical protein